LARGSSLKVRRVTSADERNSSQFFSLKKTGESFTGIALFMPDPELEDNPGYFEYFDHWDQKGTQYVPCAGDKCPFCKTGDRPSTRAKTLWFVDDEVKIFTLNWSMINEFADMLSEDETILGQAFRIKRLDDRGKYRITPKTDSMKKKELTKLLESDDLPDLEDLVTAQLRRSLEDIDVASAMEEDDDDDGDEDEEKPKARRGKKADKKSKNKKDEPDDDDEGEGDEPEDIEDETMEVTSVSKAKDTIKLDTSDVDGVEDDEIVVNVGENDVTDFKKGMEITADVTYDSDEEEWTLEEWTAADDGEGDEEGEEGEEGEGDDDNELPSEVKKEEFEVVEVDAEEETMDVKNDDYEFTLYFLDEGDASKVDFDDYEEGDTVIVSAAKDSEGDMVAIAVPKKKGSGKKDKKKSKKKKK
jgi:hypothetical protein